MNLSTIFSLDAAGGSFRGPHGGRGRAAAGARLRGRQRSRGHRRALRRDRRGLLRGPLRGDALPGLGADRADDRHRSGGRGGFPGEPLGGLHRRGAGRPAPDRLRAAPRGRLRPVHPLPRHLRVHERDRHYHRPAPDPPPARQPERRLPPGRALPAARGPLRPEPALPAALRAHHADRLPDAGAHHPGGALAPRRARLRQPAVEAAGVLGADYRRNPLRPAGPRPPDALGRTAADGSWPWRSPCRPWGSSTRC